MMQQERKQKQPVDVEVVVSLFIRIGVIMSGTVIITGMLMFLLSGHSGYPDDTYPTSIREIIMGCLSLKPYGIMLTGLVLLILTPVLRVGVTIIVFLKEKDYIYVAITSIVFIILIISLSVGK